MSHYLAYAIIPADGDATELVTALLAPYDENCKVEQVTEDGETWWTNPDGVWDWWVIGGRWTGTLSAGYDPRTDPRNIENCDLCHGSGRRDDRIGREYRATHPDYTCNGCSGIGARVKWPTEWVAHPGDTADALDVTSRIADIQVPYALFVHGSERPAVLQETWNGEDWITHHDEASMRQILLLNLSARMDAGLKDRVVVVDCHS